MRLSDFRRVAFALCAVLSLLFSQLASASYVCPTDNGSPPMAEMIASGQPCDGLDTAQPALCHEHGASTAKTFEAVKLPVLSLPLTVQMLELPAVPDRFEAVGGFVSRLAEARPPPDPVFRSTLRLRV